MRSRYHILSNMSSIAKQSRAYTPVEREIFLSQLNDYKEVIENKKTDAASNKQKENAWKEIADNYNALSSTTQERSVPQLKKWWSNIKQAHRVAKTKERQSRLGTGGGPETNVSKDDPLVETIAPHLMAHAPAIFSSNMTTAEIENSISAIENGSMEIFAVSNASQDTGSEAESASSMTMADLGPGSLPSSMDMEISEQGQKNPEIQISAPMKRKRNELSISSSSTSESSKTSLESNAKVERIKIITGNEQELHRLKLAQEKELIEEKKAHLRRMYALEEREALAKALLAEMELAAAKQKYGM